MTLWRPFNLLQDHLRLQIVQCDFIDSVLEFHSLQKAPGFWRLSRWPVSKAEGPLAAVSATLPAMIPSGAFPSVLLYSHIDKQIKTFQHHFYTWAN